MDATALVETLRGRGVTFWSEGDRLRFRPASALTDADRDALREHKPAILRLLGNAPDVAAFVRSVHARGISLVCYPDGDMWWGRGLTPAEVAFVAGHRAAVLEVLERGYGGGFLSNPAKG